MAFAREEVVEIDKDANVIMVGYSGGGLATEWAIELKASYAQDLPIVGAVIGGAPPNIANVYHNVNEGQFAELDVWAMLGIMNAYPDMDQWMRKDLRTDAYQDRRFLLEKFKCTYEKGTLAETLEGRNISSLFKSGDRFLTKFKPILDEIGIMGQNITEENKPNFPLVFFYGTVDEVTAPIEDTEKLIEKWRGVGACVFDWPLEGKDHSTALIPGMLRAFPWMNTRFWNVENGRTGKCPHAATGFQGQMVLVPSHELR
jgi:triacylglycerol lipase